MVLKRMVLKRGYSKGYLKAWYFKVGYLKAWYLKAGYFIAG